MHRDYRKGEGEKAPSAAISILDSVANPDYVSATTEAWKSNSDTSEGYAKSVSIDGNPGFETFEKDTKHATLWVMIANRYFVQIELQNDEPERIAGVDQARRSEKTGGDQVTAVAAALWVRSPVKAQSTMIASAACASFSMAQRSGYRLTYSFSASLSIGTKRTGKVTLSFS